MFREVIQVISLAPMLLPLMHC